MSTTSVNTGNPSRNWWLLAVFIVVVVGVGMAIGFTFRPGEWYQTLNKPPFNPPNWIFGPVWTTLYVMIAVAGWRVFTTARDSTAMKLWYSQMVLNWLWTPLWFGYNLVWPAFVVIIAMLITIIAFIARARPIDRPAAWLFVPYALWVAFASLLNLSIGILN